MIRFIRTEFSPCSLCPRGDYPFLEFFAFSRGSNPAFDFTQFTYLGGNSK